MPSGSPAARLPAVVAFVVEDDHPGRFDRERAPPDVELAFCRHGFVDAQGQRPYLRCAQHSLPGPLCGHGLELLGSPWLQGVDVG